MSSTKLVALTGLLLALICSGCETLQGFNFSKPTAQITGIQFGDASLNSAQLLFDVEINNPYAVSLPLTNLDYNLSSGAETFLKGDAKLQSSIPANSKKTVSLPVNVNYLELFKSLKNIKPGTIIPYKAGVGLSVDTPGLGPMTLPLKKEGNLSLPEVTGTDIMNIWNTVKPKN